MQQHLWAILPDCLGSPLPVERAPDDPQAFITGRAIEALQDTTRSGIHGSTAVIPIVGPVRPRASRSLFDMLFGGGSVALEDLAQDLAIAEENPQVEAILFYVDSPGGQVAGVHEFAELVAGTTKPTTVFVEGMAASAAYWISSAADEIVASKTAELGSIGVIVQAVDRTGLDEQFGIKRTVITNTDSPLKNIDPTSREGRARIQQNIDVLGDLFINTVAENRGVSRDHVISEFGQGYLVIGEQAVAAGLADRIGSFDGLLAELSSSSQPQGLSMPQAQQGDGAGAITAEMIAEQHPDIAEALRQEGRTQALADAKPRHEAAVEAARAEGAEMERGRIQAIEQSNPEASVRPIVDEVKYDPEANEGTVALAIVQAQREGRIDHFAAMREDAEEPLATQTDPDDQESAEAQVQRDAAVAAAQSVNEQRGFAA